MIEKGSVVWEMESDFYRFKSKWWNAIDRSTEKWDQMWDEAQELIAKYDESKYLRRSFEAFYFRCYDFVNGIEPEKFNGRL